MSRSPTRSDEAPSISSDGQTVADTEQAFTSGIGADDKKHGSKGSSSEDDLKKTRSQNKGSEAGAAEGQVEGDEEVEDEKIELYRKQLLREKELSTHPVQHGLSLAMKNLSVIGSAGSSIVFAPTVGSLFNPLSGRQDKKSLPKVDKKQANYILKDVSGLIRAGDMLLVLGRPGSGTTTLLKSLAGLHNGFKKVEGDIYYGNLDPKTIKPYSSNVIFNGEEEVHYPNLKVGQTLRFALSNSTPHKDHRGTMVNYREKGEGEEEETAGVDAVQFREKQLRDMLYIFGLEHTIETKVGDSYVRGVSGGERKRTSIAEVFTRRSLISFFDNSTRGLDANTALSFSQILRVATDVGKKTSIACAYQAGNQIFKQFNKVVVIAEGREIYFGPRSEAQGYFESLGFECMPGANVADYLTGCTVRSERKLRKGVEEKDVPTTVEEFVKRWKESDIKKRMDEELEAYLADEELRRNETEEMISIAQEEKWKGAPKRSPYTTNLAVMVKTALIREYQLRWLDRYTFWARQITTFIQAWIIGSLFYAMPLNTGGIFVRGGTMFLSLLFPGLIALSETTAAFEGRQVLAKHQGYSLYRPGSLIIAQTIADLPIFTVQLGIFAVIVYFMTGLKLQAGAFFIYYLFLMINTITMTAYFRMVAGLFGTFQNASKVSGLSFSILVTYAGYVLPQGSMHPWFSWLRWLDPVYYSFEALMSNEFTGQTFTCTAPYLVPSGTGYTMGQNQGCGIGGSQPGATSVEGAAYLEATLAFTRSHLWRNLGILFAWMAFLIVATVFVFERIPAAGASKSILLYKRGGNNKIMEDAAKNGNEPRDEEEGPDQRQVTEKPSNPRSKEEGSNNNDNGNSDIHTEGTVFSWKDLTYTVKAGGKDLPLLNKVSGYCKPGTLTALMGSSGAGKTTLLDVLAQRKDEGEITGEVLVDGKPIPVSFQRTTGYCEQLDIHLPQATVREALEFSALLRQPRDVSDKEKLAYVDTIIDLLELHDLQDALVGLPGAGLDVEQRKRLTIGVELVSKPKLLFLDEPTSGLDGQSSFLIVTFLRKLVDAGQAVLCTIHQPSASLFAEFDTLLLLKAGGHTVYFGKVDKLAEYFEENGVHHPKEVNLAEFMIDVVSGNKGGKEDWADVWRNSKNAKTLQKEIKELIDERSGKEMDVDEHEYASSMATQFKLVLRRANVQMFRDTEYVTNKFALHIGSALFNGFSFWMLSNSYADMQNRLFTIFSFIFVAPGVIAQTQPKFIENRNIFESREKKAKLYSWWAFIYGEIVAEVPYLLACAFLYWACWYATVGFSFAPGVAGPVFLEMVLYEFLYTGIGQFVAAYAPNATFAALINPLLIGVLVSFSGVFVPYEQITAFWRYWLYYINPFNYLMGAMLVFPIWDVTVTCNENEYAVFTPPSGETCGNYMADYMKMQPGYLKDPSSTTQCMYCLYSKGSEYLQTKNLLEHYYGYRDIGITALFCLSSYAFVFVLMKARSKKSKSAKSE